MSRPGAATRRLIVNGDDLGRSESTTFGVLEGHRRGIITSTSIVAGGPFFDLAARLARETPGLGVGIHLALQEYRPVMEPAQVPTLLQDDGSFYPAGTGLRRILLGQVSPADVKKEWTAQLQKVWDNGIRPTHIDGHCHCHAHPAFADVLVEVATRFEVRAIRLPRESLARLAGGARFSLRRYLEKAGLYWASSSAAATWRRSLVCPDAFFGFSEAGRMTRGALEAIAARLPAGVSELMVHPGTSNDDPPFSNGYDWRGDLEAVTSYSSEQFQERFGVRLVSYREAWRPEA